jgi:hypothetical protein
LVHAEVRRLEAQIEQSGAPREVQGTLLRRKTSALFQEIGNIVGGKGAVLEGIGQGTGDGFWAIDVTQGDELAYGMMRVEAALCELAVREFGLGREGQKAPEELVIAGFFALRQEWLGMIGVFEIPMAVIAAGVEQWRWRLTQRGSGTKKD